MSSDRRSKIPCKFKEKRPPRSANFRGPGPRRVTSLTGSSVPRGSDAALISELLASPEIAAMVKELEDGRETGRKGYGSRALIGGCLVKSLYGISTWSRTARLISEHSALQDALGGVPSVYALYRFGAKLRRFQPILDACLDRLTGSISAELPDYGRDIAIDASSLEAFANGQRFVSQGGRERERFSDPDASWGHRSAVSTRKGGGYYGFKISAAVCTRTDLPIAWRVDTARAHESSVAEDLLDRVRERVNPETATLDKGYDVSRLYDACAEAGVLPIIPLKETYGVKRGDHRPPECEHGTWTFAGSDTKRGASKWRCPTGECKPASRWVRANRLHPLIPRESKRWRDLYRGRAAVEREFGRLKHQYGLAPLRVRGLERVALHADLVMLARLASALARARAVPLAA